MAGGDYNWSTRAEDVAIEAAVIAHLLNVHPTQLTIGELIREMSGEQPGFAERDAIERAVRDLAGIGLLHRNEEFVAPTRAAIRFSELMDR